MREDSLTTPSIAELIAEILKLKYGREFSLPFARLQADAGYLNIGDIEKEIRSYGTLSYKELQLIYEMEFREARARANATKRADASLDEVDVSQSASRHGTARAIQLLERNDVLSPFIEAALKECKDPNNASEVWVHLVALAKEGRRPPFLEASDGEIKYINAEDKVRFLNVNSLRKRIRRRKPR